MQKTKKELSKLDEKLEKLMNAYLENVLTLPEYQKTKNILVNQKQILKDKLKSFEQKSNNRFELADKFIKDSRQAKIIALQESRQAGRDFLKKIGSNFQIQNQAVSFSPRGAWQIVAKWGFGARSAPAERLCREAISSQNDEIVKFAEREGFEPSIPCGIPPFQGGALGHYATSPNYFVAPLLTIHQRHNLVHWND